MESVSCGYPRIKSVMGTGRVANWVPVGIINRYLTIRYYMNTDTDLMIPVPAGIPSYPLINYLNIHMYVYKKP